MQRPPTIKKNFIKMVTPSLQKQSAKTVQDLKENNGSKSKLEQILPLQKIIPQPKKESGHKRIREQIASARMNNKVYLI